MKTSTFIAIATGLTASLVSAQGLDSIPECALGCAVTGLGSSGCSPTDIACVCNASSFIQGLIPCVQEACSTPEAFQDTVEAAQALCLAAGVTLTIQPPSATTTDTTTVPTDTATITTTETSATETATETETETSATETETTTVAPTPSGNTTQTGTQPPAPTGTDDSSAAKNAIAFGGIALAFFAALL